jgi:hypothetical protein
MKALTVKTTLSLILRTSSPWTSPRLPACCGGKKRTILLRSFGVPARASAPTLKKRKLPRAGQTSDPSGLRPPPFVTWTRSLLLVSPAVACGYLPRAPSRSGARYLLLKNLWRPRPSLTSLPFVKKPLAHHPKSKIKHQKIPPCFKRLFPPHFLLN